MPQNYRKDALIIFCLLAFVYAYFYQDGAWNANSRFSLIFALVQEGRLTIDSYNNKPGTETGDVSFFDGHYYSDKAIGVSVAGAIAYVPLYWMKRLIDHPNLVTVKMTLTFLVIGLPSAISGCLIYILCLYWTKSRFRSFWTALAIALGTMALPYGVIFFSHQFASSLLFGAFFLIYLLKVRPEAWQNGYLFLIGLLLGWALIAEYPTSLIILALAVYYLSIVWRNQAHRHWRSLVLPVLGGAVPLLLQLVYNRLCFGNFLTIGYQTHQNSYFVSEMGKGLMGIHWPDLRVLFYMTLHPTMGVFWQSPVLLLSAAGAVVAFRKRPMREEAILSLWVIVSYFVIQSGYYMWWGGFALGPRHIIPVLPFFCILLAFVPKRLNWPFVILGLASIGQMTIAAASSVLVPDTMAQKINSLGFFEYSNIYSYCLRQLIIGHFPQNLGYRLLGLKSWSSLVPLLGIAAGITVTFFWNSLRAVHRPNMRIHPAWLRCGRGQALPGTLPAARRGRGRDRLDGAGPG
jgi:hypothetical protein